MTFHLKRLQTKVSRGVLIEISLILGKRINSKEKIKQNTHYHKLYHLNIADLSGEDIKNILKSKGFLKFFDKASKMIEKVKMNLETKSIRTI